MAVDHSLESSKEVVNAGAGIKSQQGMAQIGVADGLQLMVEEDAFLEGGERIDVLDIGGAAIDAGDDGVDLVLRQRNQGQQVRGDALASGKDSRRSRIRLCG